MFLGHLGGGNGRYHQKILDIKMMACYNATGCMNNARNDANHGR